MINHPYQIDRMEPMKLKDIINRKMPPKPWADGEKIPWNDPGFSERMLKEHLSQDHDMASRRQMIIDMHVSWINETCLHGQLSRVLDLGCGPGLYSQRLAQLGHACVGIDFSPASIAHAKSQSALAGLMINYVCGDIRIVEYDEGFDLAMLIFGEFNVFAKDDARELLRQIHKALKPGGCILLEPETYDAIMKVGETPASWHSEQGGLFSPTPHLWLEEHFWHVDDHAATTRYFILDASTGAVDVCASTSQAYSDDDFDQLLTEAGFSEIKRYPSLTGSEIQQSEELFVLIAKKA
jgi:SAM-dependent methyltransferase